MKTTSFFRYAAIAFVVIVLSALGGWYFFLSSAQDDIDAADQGRGSGLSSPSFGDAIGSTYSNVISTLTSVFGGGSNVPDDTLQRLTSINKTPTAGFGFSDHGTTTKLRFVERSTGYIFDAELKNGALSRVSNKLVPRVYEAKIARDGKVLERTISDGGQVVSVSVSASTTGELDERSLPSNLGFVTFNPTGSEIFAIQKTVSGDAAGVRAAWNGTGLRNVFSSAITGWHAFWLRDGRIVLVQNPSDNASGYAYELSADGSLTPILGNIPGLTVLPRASSTALIFGSSVGNSLTLYARPRADAAQISLPIRTTADKCVWSAGVQLIAFCAVPQRPTQAGYLAERARGEAHTADAWWRVDIGTGSAELLYSPGDIALDVEQPMISDDGAYIAFMNRIDRSLWLLRIAQQ